MKVWLNGTLCDEARAHIAPGDRGFTLGDGLFETMRAQNGGIPRLHAHLARLMAGARVIGLPIPEEDFAAVIGEVVIGVLKANGLNDGVVRLTVTRGPGPRGVLPPTDPSPTVLITAAPLSPPPPPARLVISRVTRRNEFSPLCRVKSLNYLDNILARQEAASHHADDAILLNTQSRVAETTIANVFAVLDGRLVTPPLSDGMLPGVMRAAVLGHGAEEAPLTEADLDQAEEIFLTSSLGIRSVFQMEGRALTQFSAANRLRDLLEFK